MRQAEKQQHGSSGSSSGGGGGGGGGRKEIDVPEGVGGFSFRENNRLFYFLFVTGWEELRQLLPLLQ
jgi:hypothetical protein